MIRLAYLACVLALWRRPYWVRSASICRSWLTGRTAIGVGDGFGQAADVFSVDRWRPWALWRQLDDAAHRMTDRGDVRTVQAIAMRAGRDGA